MALQEVVMMSRRKPMNGDDGIVARNLKRLRRKRRMSHARLGKLVGLSGEQIRHYENERNPIAAGTLRKMAKALDVEEREFFEER